MTLQRKSPQNSIYPDLPFKAGCRSEDIPCPLYGLTSLALPSWHGNGNGNGIALPCLAAPVRAMRLATAAGEIVELDREKTPDQLAAAQVSLGMLGIVLDLALDLVPAYDLHERLWQAPFEEGIEAAEELARANRHFMFFWCPHEHSGSLFSLPDTVSAGQEPRPDMCEMRVMNLTDAPTACASLVPGHTTVSTS